MPFFLMRHLTFSCLLAPYNFMMLLTEECQRGRSGRSRKPLCGQPYRGFESHLLRQIFYRELFSRLFALASVGLKTPVFMGFSELYSVIRPVPYFLSFHHFTPKISIFDLSISDTCEHWARRYACPKTLDLPMF